MTNPNPSTRANPIERLRMAKRVSSQLSDLEDEILLEADQEGPMRTSTNGVASDFLISSLDLRLRLSLLTENTGWASITEKELDAAQSMLLAHPDTDAAVLTVNDPQLTSVVLEPFDRRDAILVPSTTAGMTASRYTCGPGPVRTVVVEYFRTVIPRWDEIDKLPRHRGVDVKAVAQATSREAVNRLRQQNFRVVEKARARDSIGERESKYIQDLAIRLIQGDQDIVQALTDFEAER